MMSVILITRVRLMIKSNNCETERKGNKYTGLALHRQPGPDLLHAGYFLWSREEEGGRRVVCLVGRPPAAAAAAGQAGVEVQLLGDSSEQSLIDLFLPLVGTVSSQLLSYPQ